MFQNHHPRQITDIGRNVTCKVPLCNVDECQCKKCNDTGKTKDKPYHVPDEKYLETTDRYWAEFLKAQQTSSANYMYQMQIYGDNQDPTLVRKDPFPPELVHQRLLHMPVVGALDKDDIFYILSFLLNFLQLTTEKQEEYMEMFQTQGLLNNEILNYMQIIARHPNTGIPPDVLEDFMKLTQDVIDRTSTVCNSNFFNPDRIFMKSMIEMDPYELAYLKTIMEAKGQLSKDQFMYLVNFVERLQEMPLSRRDQYLKVLHEKSILPSSSFPALVYYIRKKSKKFNRQKLIALWYNLVTLMDIAPCFSKPVEEAKIVERVTEIDIDALKVRKALKDLMKGGIPNIIRLMDMKQFLQDIMHLNGEQLEQVLNQLKNMSLITLEEFKFMQNFIAKETLKADEEQKKLLLKTLQKVASTPPSLAPTVVLAIPPSKGPIPPAVKPPVVAKAATDTDKGKQKETKTTTEVVGVVGKDVTLKDGTTKDDKGKGTEKNDKTCEKKKKTKKGEKQKSEGKSNSKSKTKRKAKEKAKAKPKPGAKAKK